MNSYRYGSAYVGKHVKVDPSFPALAGPDVRNRITQNAVHDIVRLLIERERVMVSEGKYDFSVEMVVVTAEEIHMLYQALMSSREAAAHAMREIFGDWPQIPGEIRFPETSFPVLYEEDL